MTNQDTHSQIREALTDERNLDFLAANLGLVVATSVNGSPDYGAPLADQLGAVLELGVLALLEGHRATLSSDEFAEYGVPDHVEGLRFADEHGAL
jgi:hypothetical protein